MLGRGDIRSTSQLDRYRGTLRLGDQGDQGQEVGGFMSELLRTFINIAQGSVSQ